jgi:hypothetical protein
VAIPNGLVCPPGGLEWMPKNRKDRNNTVTLDRLIAATSRRDRPFGTHTEQFPQTDEGQCGNSRKVSSEVKLFLAISIDKML